MAVITGYALGFERQPLLAPFGFKGGYVSDVWNIAAQITSDNGKVGLGLGLQSVLWSDPGVFASLSPSGGNSYMYLITEFALKQLVGKTLANPVSMLDEIFQASFAYAKTLTGMPQLRPTFVLNALVPVDMALWRLFAEENGIRSFDTMIPAFARPMMTFRHGHVGNIPLVTYGLDMPAVKALADNGAFLIKMKIGNDPDKDGSQEKMLAWDMQRLTDIHNTLKDYRTPYTESGKLLYYLDANSRYADIDTALRLLDHADKIGALGQIVLFEEPFAEGSGIDVRQMPVTVAADESAHSVDDIPGLLELGYTAIALKPIAKTVSMSFQILQEAAKSGAACFCADLTVNPLMVEWNKNFAARIAPLPGVKIGVMESNGSQNYVNWQAMTGYHPQGAKPWVSAENGVFTLNEEFYQAGGGIFEPAPHYETLAKGI